MSSVLTNSKTDKVEKKEATLPEKPSTPTKQSNAKGSSPEKHSPKKSSPEKSSETNNSLESNNVKTPQTPEKVDKEKLTKAVIGNKEANSSSPKKNNAKQSDNESTINKESESGTSVPKEIERILKTATSESSESKEKEQINKSNDNLTKIKSENLAATVNDKTSDKSSIDDKKDDSIKELKLNEEKQSKNSSEESKSVQTSDKNNNESSVKKEKSLQSKYQLRTEIWNKMLHSSMLAYRKPCIFSIPHFKDDIISAGRLTTMEIFQQAKVVKVILDKAHECVRLQVIEAGKEMIVGCPGLREAVFLHVKPPMGPSKSSIKLASSRFGIGHVGTALDFSCGTQADLVIVGSVAVDRTGLRVGKGEGFADLEFALLKKLGGIAHDAPIITVVHDSQVYDTLPEELFREHDVPADYIVTPTEVIEVSPKRKHPDLIWNILSNRRVNNIPIIKQLLDKEKNRDGVDVCLKEEDTDNEDLEQIARRKRYFIRKRTNSNASQRSRQIMNGNIIIKENIGLVRSPCTRRHSTPLDQIYQEMMMPVNRQNRNYRSYSVSSNFFPLQHFTQQRQNWMARNFQNGTRRNNGWKMFRPRCRVAFSLKVQGLTNQMRVRDLKAAVTQRGIHPKDISWLPHKGMAFLHFTEPKNPVDQTPIPRDTESLLATLKDLTIKAENGPETNVKVEPAQPFRKVHFVV